MTAAAQTRADLAAAEVKARIPILEFAQRYTTLKYKCRDKAGGYEYAGPCPLCQAGEDRFVVWSGEGRYKCRVCTPHAGDVIALEQAIHGGTFWDAVARLGGTRPALGVTISAPPPVPAGKKVPKVRSSATPRKVAEHLYRHTDGTPTYRKDRWEPAKQTPGRDKDFIYYHPDPARPGAWLLGLTDDIPRTLYNWPAIAAAAAGDVLYLVEGEGKADALTALGLLAGSPDGPWRDEYTGQVQGLELVICQDNDQHGADLTAQITAACADKVRGIRVLAWPDQPQGYDVFDWLAAGHTADELAALVAAAPEWQPTAAPKPPASRLRTLAELAALPPPAWLIDGLIPRGALTAIYGPTGTGKSFMALDWALTVATGAGTWMEHSTQRGRVVYVAAEGYTGLVKRAEAWQESRSRHNTEDLFIWSESVNLMDPAAVELLLADVQSRAPDPALIIIDTLARCLVGGDENSAKDMGLFVAGADRLRTATGATVLILHHTGVAEGRERGSTALRAAVDTMIAQSKDDQVIRLECVKQKDAPEFEPSTWQLTPAADSVVLTPASASALAGTQAQMTPDQRAVLTFLVSPILMGGASSAEIASGTQLLPHRVYRALSGLEARGHLEFDGPPKTRNRHFWPSPTGHAMLALTHITHKSLTVSDVSLPPNPETHRLTSLTTPLGGVSVSECESGGNGASEQVTPPYFSAPPLGEREPAEACPTCGEREWAWHSTGKLEGGWECAPCQAIGLHSPRPDQGAPAPRDASACLSPARGPAAGPR